jgi:hypothetical protein
MGNDTLVIKYDGVDYNSWIAWVPISLLLGGLVGYIFGGVTYLILRYIESKKPGYFEPK